jgi:hypothetical protein
VAQDTKRPASAAAIDVQFGLDFGFEYFEVFVDAAGGHAAEFSINQGEVGKNGQAKC